MKRRLAALTLCFAMAASMLAGCGEKEEDDNKELVLYTWEGLFPQEVLDGFEKETGIKIISSNFDTNETMLEKIQQTDGKDYDIVVGDDYIIEQIVKNGLAKKLDKTQMAILTTSIHCIRASFMIRTMNIQFPTELVSP